MLTLRDYQQRLQAAIRDAWTRCRAVLAVCPTGGGKTVVFAAEIHDHNGAAAAVVHRKEILGQISEALGRLDVVHRIVAPPATVRMIRRRHLKKLGRSFIDPQAQVGVVSVQTLTARSAERDKALRSWLNRVTLAVFDEGHHYTASGFWAKGVEQFDRARLLFVSASPSRADGQGLGCAEEGGDGFAEAMVEGPTTRWLIKQGYLAPFTYKAPATDLDVEGLAHGKGGDFTAKALRSRVVESHLVGDVVRHYGRFAAGKKAIVFADSVATSEELAEAFRSAGYTAAALSGQTDDGEREARLLEFESGGLQVLVNVDLFDEGFDVAGVEAVVMARPTESLAKFLQMIGRALRPVYADGYDLKTQEGRLAAIAAGDKPQAVILDPVRNWERHGMPDWPRDWTLASREKGSQSASDTVPQRTCLACTSPYEAFYKACPYCGHVPEPPERSRPEQVDGDLFELDVEAMAALMERQRAADMEDNDFRRDMIARQVPSIGQPRQLRAHQAAKHRRRVLRELVAWWMGLQPPERELGEKYRRFFHRFGVDIGTAHTLDAAGTDALIAKISKRFTEDLRP